MLFQFAFVLGRPLFHAFCDKCCFPVVIALAVTHFPILLYTLYSCSASYFTFYLFSSISRMMCDMNILYAILDGVLLREIVERNARHNDSMSITTGTELY